MIDAYIDTLELSALGFRRVQPNQTGRPSYYPRALLKLYLNGYMNRNCTDNKLLARIARLNSKIEAYLAQMEELDSA